MKRVIFIIFVIAGMSGCNQSISPHVFIHQCETQDVRQNRFHRLDTGIKLDTVVALSWLEIPTHASDGIVSNLGRGLAQNGGMSNGGFMRLDCARAQKHVITVWTQ